VLSALLSGDWAAWLRGSNKRLREVPVQAGLSAACRADVERAVQHQLLPANGGDLLLPLVSPEVPVTPLLLAEVPGSSRQQAAPGDLADGGGTMGTENCVSSSSSSHQGVEALMCLLWQQQQQLSSDEVSKHAAAAAGIRQQQQQQRKGSLSIGYAQRVLAALPVAGGAAVQLPRAVPWPEGGR